VYSCVAENETRKITIRRFTNSRIDGGEEFSITFDSILNPGFEDMKGLMTVTTIGVGLGTIDTGSFEFESDYFKRGYVKLFTVNPQNFGVGQFPVFYDFTI
jgi:hypothetical protein